FAAAPRRVPGRRGVVACGGRCGGGVHRSRLPARCVADRSGSGHRASSCAFGTPRLASGPAGTWGPKLERAGTARRVARVTFSVETGGTRRTIEIQRAGEGWAVTVDGQAMSAIVNPVEGHWSVLYGAGEAPASRRSYEVALEPRRKGDQL